MNNSISEIARIWQKTLKLINERLNEREIFDNFFASSYINDIRGNTVTVVVTSATAERLLSTKYIDIIRDTIAEVTENNYDLVFMQQSSVAKSNIQQKSIKKRT